MSTIRVKHGRENPYFSMARETAQDRRLSYEARGMLGYLLSKPDDWTLQKSDLQMDNTEDSDLPTCGRDKVNRIVGELLMHKYLKQIETRNEQGQFNYEWTVYETPYTENPLTVKPHTVKPPLHKRERQSKENITPNGGGKTLAPMTSMKNAIKAAFYPDKTDKQVTKAEWGVIQAAAKQLIDAEALPEHIPALFAYCKSKFNTFTAMAMATHLNNWRNTLPRATNGTPPAAPAKPTLEQIERENAELDRILAPKPIFGNPVNQE